MLSRSPQLRSPLFQRVGGSRVTPAKLTPLVLYDGATFRGKSQVLLTPGNAVAEVRTHLGKLGGGSPVRLVRAPLRNGGGYGGLGGLRRGTELVALNEAFQVVARIQLPLCLPVPLALPTEGLTIDALETHVVESAAAGWTTLVCACRRESVAFVVVDAKGEAVEAVPAQVFLANCSDSDGYLNGSRDAGGAPLVSATASSSSKFYSEVFEYLDRHWPAIDKCGSFIVRDQHGMFNRLGARRKGRARDELPLSEDSKEGNEATQVTTLFDDARWTDVAARLMPDKDIAIHRTPSISANAVVGCTRHGLLEIA